VLDLCEDERGFGDVAYLGRADSDVLKGAPAFLQEGEPAFALVAQAAQQYVAAFRVGIEIAFAGLFDRDEDSGAGALVAGIGEAGKGFQPGPQAGQDKLAGGGDVVGAAGQDAGGPQRDAVRGDDALDEAGVLVRLPGVPFLLVFLSEQRSEEISVPSRIT